jgi:hypothetical protein
MVVAVRLQVQYSSVSRSHRKIHASTSTVGTCALPSSHTNQRTTELGALPRVRRRLGGRHVYILGGCHDGNTPIEAKISFLLYICIEEDLDASSPPKCCGEFAPSPRPDFTVKLPVPLPPAPLYWYRQQTSYDGSIHHHHSERCQHGCHHRDGGHSFCDPISTNVVGCSVIMAQQQIEPNNTNHHHQEYKHRGIHE